MELLQLEKLYIIGIAATMDNNDHVKLAADMQNLWHKFISEGVKDQIQNKVNDNIYCVYTNYVGDYTKPYTALLGYQVTSLDNTPVGLMSKTIESALYRKYAAQGDLLHGVVFEKWQEIWNSEIPRAYIADFEVYGENAKDLTNAEVEIFIGVLAK